MIVAVTVTAWLAAGWAGVAVIPVIRGARPVWATELAAPGVKPRVAVDAAQFNGSLWLWAGSTSSRDGPFPSGVTGQSPVSENVTESTTAAEASMTETFSPLLDSLPVYTAFAVPPYVVW